MFGVLVVVLGRDPIARLEFSLGQRQVPGHSFFSRCKSPVAPGGAHSMPTAVSGQQVTLPVSVDAYSCLSYGHSAWLHSLVMAGENAPCCARRTRIGAALEE